MIKVAFGSAAVALPLSPALCVWLYGFVFGTVCWNSRMDPTAEWVARLVNSEWLKQTQSEQVYGEAWAISWLPFWLGPFFSPAAPVIMYGSTGFWLIFGHATPRRKRKPLLSSISAALVCRHYRHLNPLFVAAAWASFSRALDRIWQIENPFVASGCPCVHAWPYPALHNFNPVPQKCLLICIAKLPRCWDPGESFSSRHSLRFNYSLLGLVLIPLPSIWHCSLRLHNFALVCPRVESHLAEKYTL